MVTFLHSHRLVVGKKKKHLKQHTHLQIQRKTLQEHFSLQLLTTDRPDEGWPLSQYPDSNRHPFSLADPQFLSRVEDAKHCTALPTNCPGIHLLLQTKRKRLMKRTKSARASYNLPLMKRQQPRKVWYLIFFIFGSHHTTTNVLLMKRIVELKCQFPKP